MVVKDINVSRLLDDYLDHLKTSGTEMGLFAARSVILHKIDKGCGLFSKPEDVAEWIRRRGVTNETRKQYAEHLQAFYEWVAAKRGCIYAEIWGPSRACNPPAVQGNGTTGDEQ